MPIAFATILPSVLMNDNRDPVDQKSREAWWAALEAMLSRWRDQDNVRETARIAYLITLPTCGQQGLGIAPDGRSERNIHPDHAE